MDHSEKTYVIFNIPVTRVLKTNFKHLLEEDTYEQFYQFLEDKFFSACTFKQISLAAMVADGRLPLVRNSKIDKNAQNEELQKLSFDTNSQYQQFTAQWDKDHLVDTLNFVVVAESKDNKDVGYGKFMNNVEAMIRSFCQTLELSAQKQELNVRFFQHISYDA